MPTKDGKKEIAKETKRFRNEIDLFGKVNTEVILIDEKNVIRLKFTLYSEKSSNIYRNVDIKCLVAV